MCVGDMHRVTRWPLLPSLKADFQESLLQTHTWAARATQVSPDRATRIVFIYACPHLQPQACLLFQNIILELRPHHRTLMRQVSFHPQHLVLRSGSLKKQTEKKCITYEVSWVSFLLLKNKNEKIQNQDIVKHNMMTLFQKTITTFICMNVTHTNNTRVF